MDERDVLVLQRFHVADEARLWMMRIENGLRQIVAVPLPDGALQTGGQHVGFLRHLQRKSWAHWSAKGFQLLLFDGYYLVCGAVYLENAEEIVDVFFAHRFVNGYTDL